MGFLGHRFNFKARQAMLGLIAGINLAALAFFFAIPLFIPTPAGAQASTSLKSCFTPSECKKEMTNNGLCSSRTGCCIDDRCFIPDKQCQGGIQGQCYARPSQITLSVKIGATQTVVELGDYIKTAYNYALGIATLIAAVMMMVGGFRYLTAGGDAAKVSKGKANITNALLGLVLAFGAFLLLQTINPDLVELRMPKVAVVKKQIYMECASTELCKPCGESYGVTQKFLDDSKTPGAIKADQICSAKYIVAAGASGSVTTCYGKSCSLASGAQCGDNEFRCRKPKTADEKSDCSNMKTAPSGSASTVVYLCMNCKKDGEACSPNGSNDQCCNGFCGKNKCTSGQPGDPCNDNTDCIGRICQTSWGNACSSGGIGSPCANNSECASGLCQTFGVKNNCSDGSQYSFCGNQSECRGGLICNGILNICWPKEGMPYPETCTISGCPAGLHCSTWYDPDRCVPLGQPGAPCSKNSDCAPAFGHADGFCASSASVCTDGSAGGRCDDDSDCLDGHCYTGGNYDVCVTGGPGSRCDNNDDCLKTLVCQGNKCQK